MKCTVRCNGCAGLVEGAISHYDGVTAGFYLRGWLPVTNKGRQTDVFPEGKNILCDYCMQSSDAYKALYGDRIPAVGRAPARPPCEGEVIRSYDDLLAYIRDGQWPTAIELAHECDAAALDGLGRIGCSVCKKAAQ